MGKEVVRWILKRSITTGSGGVNESFVGGLWEVGGKSRGGQDAGWGFGAMEWVEALAGRGGRGDIADRAQDRGTGCACRYFANGSGARNGSGLHADCPRTPTEDGTGVGLHRQSVLPLTSGTPRRTAMAMTPLGYAHFTPRRGVNDAALPAASSVDPLPSPCGPGCIRPPP